MKKNSGSPLLWIILLVICLVIIVYRSRKTYVDKEILPLWKTSVTAATETPVAPVSIDDSEHSVLSIDDSGHDADHSVLSTDDSDHDSFWAKQESTFLSATEFGRYLLERQEQMKKMRWKERETIQKWEEVEFRTWLNAQNYTAADMGGLGYRLFVFCQRQKYYKLKEKWMKLAREEYGL